MNKYSDHATGFTKIYDKDWNVTKERMTFPILIRKIRPVRTPEKNGACFDLFLPEDVTVQQPGTFFFIPLGVCIKFPKGYYAELLVRSSTPLKWGIELANSVGIIDGAYCGDKDEWKMLVRRPYGLAIAYPDIIPVGTRIAQFKIVKGDIEENGMGIDFEFQEVEHLPDPSRGGFGSTGA